MNFSSRLMKNKNWAIYNQQRRVHKYLCCKQHFVGISKSLNHDWQAYALADCIRLIDCCQIARRNGNQSGSTPTHTIRSLSSRNCPRNKALKIKFHFAHLNECAWAEGDRREVGRWWTQILLGDLFSLAAGFFCCCRDTTKAIGNLAG